MILNYMIQMHDLRRGALVLYGNELLRSLGKMITSFEVRDRMTVRITEYQFEFHNKNKILLSVEDLKIYSPDEDDSSQ